ncbi:MAG: hypothetical protein ABJE95_16455 [Byssovorax sp.]
MVHLPDLGRGLDGLFSDRAGSGRALRVIRCRLTPAAELHDLGARSNRPPAAGSAHRGSMRRGIVITPHLDRRRVDALAHRPAHLTGRGNHPLCDEVLRLKRRDLAREIGVGHDIAPAELVLETQLFLTSFDGGEAAPLPEIVQRVAKEDLKLPIAGLAGGLLKLHINLSADGARMQTTGAGASA